MKKIIPFLFICLSFSGFAQKGYRYSVVPGTDNTFLMTSKEAKTITYASTVTVTPTQEKTIYNFAQLTGAISIVAKITQAYTGDEITCIFHADGSDRVVTFSTGITSAGTFTIPASTYSLAQFVFNGVAWEEISRQNNVSGSVTTLLSAAGTVGAPAISYTGQTDLGFYKVSATQEGFSSAGTLVGGFNSTGLFTGKISEQVTGYGINIAQQTFQNRTATSYTVTGAVTGAQLAKGLLAVASGTCTLTLPTGTDLGNTIGATAGTTFDFVLLNIASGGTATIAANTNAIAGDYGTNTLTRTNSASVGVAVFKVTFISATAYVFTRIS